MHGWVHGLRRPGETLADALRRLERSGARPEEGRSALARLLADPVAAEAVAPGHPAPSSRRCWRRDE